MEDARRRRAPDVDDVLVAGTVVGGQLYGVVAEERGIGEVLFVLGRGLDRGRVGVDVFLKVCVFVLSSSPPLPLLIDRDFFFLLLPFACTLDARNRALDQDGQTKKIVSDLHWGTRE